MLCRFTSALIPLALTAALALALLRLFGGAPVGGAVVMILAALAGLILTIRPRLRR